MIDKAMRAMMANDLAKHELRPEPPAKSWRVGTPDGSSNLAFTVTWTPGVLALAGDIGELTLTHYHAMPTWPEAVEWLDGANIDYLLEKSNARQEFDIEGSVASLIYRADDDQRYGDESSVWALIFDRVSWWSVGRMDDPAADLNPRNGAHQMMVAAALRDDCDIDQRWFYDLGIDDFYGRERWPYRAVWQTEALLLWARLVRPSLEREIAA